MKVFCATLLHESNSFSPLPTTLADYRGQFCYRPTTGEGSEVLGYGSHDMVLRDLCRARGYQIVDGIHAGAAPSARTNRADYESLRDEMMALLKAALPVDMVLLFLHGAQMAIGYDDCEGDVLRRIRAIVGPDVPIGVLLDLHCNITDAMVEHADVMIACKEYPHIDFAPRSQELVDLTVVALEKKIKPTMAFAPAPMLGFFHTTRQPMRGFVDRLQAMEGAGGVLSISLAHSFPAGDSGHTSAGVLVVTDGDTAQAKALAETLAEEFFALREEISAPIVSVAACLDQALSEKQGPVVIADVSDNTGGGSPGDSTHILRALIERGVTSAAVASIWDPVALDLIRKAGVGGRFPLRLGGKTGPLSGMPVDVMAEVLSIRDAATQIVFGGEEQMGPSAAIRCNGIEVIVAEEREQVMSPHVFSNHGIDPSARLILVVKSAQHFYQEFSKIASRILYASAPGLIGNDFSHYPYRYLKRPMWPLDNVPFVAHGRRWG